MRFRIILTIAVLFVVTSAANAQKMVVDVDKAVDFSTFRSFSWSAGQIAPKATTSQIIIDAVENELKSRGLVRNDAAPDILISVMAAAEMDLQGVGPTWNNEVYRSWGGYGNPAALMDVTKGTLLIDLVETKKNFGVFRAVVKDVFVSAPTGNPERDTKTMRSLVGKTVKKIFKKYPVAPRR